MGGGRVEAGVFCVMYNLDNYLDALARMIPLPTSQPLLGLAPLCIILSCFTLNNLKFYMTLLLFPLENIYILDSLVIDKVFQRFIFQTFWYTPLAVMLFRTP